MALANYTDLQASALDWMTRAGQSGKAPDWITLAEAKLNRELSPLEADAPFTGVPGSASLALTGLSIAKVISLWVTPVSGGDEVQVQMQSPGTLRELLTSGFPRQWCMDGQNALRFDRPCDQAYTFRFHYVERLNLATTDTNWLLTENPDVYLAATLMWGAGYNEDWNNGAAWRTVLDEAIPSIRSNIAQSRRGMLRVDPALTSVGRWRRAYNDLVNGNF